MTRVYDEVIEFIARGATSSEVADWTPSTEASERVGQLIADEKAGRLTPDQVAELDRYMQLEHIMRLAKARARLHRSS